MTIFISGTQNSGKSLLAEKLATQTGDSIRLYLATMKLCDEEGIKRVEKHRKQREGKGFITVEKQTRITEIISDLKRPEDTTVLLECVSNLVGNEMRDVTKRAELVTGDKPDLGKFADEVAEDINKLSKAVHNLIIVTNEYPAQDEGYDDETRLYVRLLSMVNSRIRAFVDVVREIPSRHPEQNT